jgi:Trypsin-co-occurring domain 1
LPQDLPRAEAKLLERPGDLAGSRLWAVQILYDALREGIPLEHGDAAGNPPDEVQVELGIILNAEAGAILASASAGANYKVTMTWKRSPS